MTHKKPLSESWLEGSLGLTSNATVHCAVDEAQRSLDGKTEEEVRKVWNDLDSIFSMWRVKKPKAKEKVLTSYLLYVHLRNEKYAPLLDFIQAVSEERALAVMILHDCAQGLNQEIAWAVRELIYRNAWRDGHDSSVKSVTEATVEYVTKALGPELDKRKKWKVNRRGGPKISAANKTARANLAENVFCAKDKEFLVKLNGWSWGQEKRLQKLVEWGKENQITKNGRMDSIIVDENSYEVMRYGDNYYKKGGIERFINGKKKGYKNS